MLGDLRFELKALTGSLPSGAGPQALVTLAAGAETAAISLPLDLLNEISIGSADVPSSELSSQAALLVLEHLLTPYLAWLEHRTNQDIGFLNIVQPGRSFSKSKLFLACSYGASSYPVGLNLWDAALDCFAGTAGEREIALALWPELPIQIAFRLGTALVSSRLLESIRPGDVIVADAMCRDDKVIVVAGERRAAAGHVQKDGARLAAPLTRLSGTDEETWSMSETIPATHDGTGQDSSFDDIAVKLMFEMGRTELSLGDLRAIAPGYIFDLSRTPANAIDIFAGSRRIGQGEVVQIGDALGVRVTRLFNNE
jgi:type III secretion protein Q